ncbi:unnamed protein product [Sphagnum balticum]
MKKTLLVMDEVDGMSGGDRGGVTAIIALIKTSKVPVICICNDRSAEKIRSLAGHCMDVRFHKPHKGDMLDRNIRRTQDWGLMPAYGLMSCVYTTEKVSESIGGTEGPERVKAAVLVVGRAEIIGGITWESLGDRDCLLAFTFSTSVRYIMRADGDQFLSYFDSS